MRERIGDRMLDYVQLYLLLKGFLSLSEMGSLLRGVTWSIFHFYRITLLFSEQAVVSPKDHWVYFRSMWLRIVNPYGYFKYFVLIWKCFLPFLIIILSNRADGSRDAKLQIQKRFFSTQVLIVLCFKKRKGSRVGVFDNWVLSKKRLINEALNGVLS